MDPARSGINFYAYCMANPLNFTDPYGLCPSKKVDLEDTGVSINKGYIKGDWLWNPYILAAHTYIQIGDQGFGMYAKSHGRGGGASAAIYDSGYIDNRDLDLYPPNNKPKSGEPYSIRKKILLDPCKYNIDDFRRSVASFNEARTDSSYMLLGWNCSDFADNVIFYSLEISKRK